MEAEIASVQMVFQANHSLEMAGIVVAAGTEVVVGTEEEVEIEMGVGNKEDSH